MSVKETLDQANIIVIKAETKYLNGLLALYGKKQNAYLDGNIMAENELQPLLDKITKERERLRDDRI